jgi:hypothetical protein
MIDITELALSGWPADDAAWSHLIDDTSIPPAQVRRAVVFDHADPLLERIYLPSAEVAEGAAPAGGHPVVVTFRDQACPECGRPVVVVFKPWGTEPRRAMVSEIRANLEALAWHDRHPR